MRTAAKNSLANMRKGPDKGGGLDWDKISRNTQERLAEEWAMGVRNADTIRQRWLLSLNPDDVKLQFDRALRGEKPIALVLGEDGEPRPANPEDIPTPKAKSSPRQYVRGSGKTGRKRGMTHYDIEEVIKLYVEDQMSPADIVEKMNGPKYETVISYLKKRGVFDRTRHRSGGSRSRESYEDQRAKYCKKCGTDLDVPGNSRPRTRKLADGTRRPSGRECVPCARKRSRESYKGWENDPRNKKNGGDGIRRGTR